MENSVKGISILDCTLRDGSYLIDYQFTAEDTYIVCLGLKRAGFKLIEIGHGTGLRSSEAGKGKAAATDEEYLQAATSALSGSSTKVGVFFIPGIGKMEDLKLAFNCGIDFVRIGTNVAEIERAKPYIEQAKSLGLMVSSNLMKSYTVSVDEFIRLAKMADQFGADVITVVDSAGGMLPSDVREYVLRLKDVTEKEIGFHGHNNLQLAIANTLEAVESGADFVDSSLQGMGRSAGNTQTEVLVMLLEKFGYRTGIDSYKTMDLGERIIKPMMSKEQGVDDISLVSGIAQFHSSFFKTIDEAARKYQIDPRMLIVEVSEIDRVHVSQDLAEATALRIKRNLQKHKNQHIKMTIDTSILKGKKLESPIDQAQLIVNEITSQSKKTGKESVFSLTLSKSGRTSFPFIRESSSLVIGNVEASCLHEASRLINVLDGRINWLLLDESASQLRESKLEKYISKSSFTWYSEERALRLSICALISQKRPEGKVLILSSGESAALLKSALKQQGIRVIPIYDLKPENEDSFKPESISTHRWKEILGQVGAVVSFGMEYAQELTGELVPFLLEQTAIYAARPGAFSPSFWEAALAKGLSVCRVDSRAGFAAELGLVIETKKVIDIMGSTELLGITLVSGGVIGQRGSVVVDSVKNPTCVIGIADGFGGLLSSEEEIPYREIKRKVREQLIKNLYQQNY